MFRKIASYSASIYGVTMCASGVSFVVTMVIARRIPREALGAYGFYVTIYALLGMLLCSGLNQALVKFLGDEPKSRAEIVRLVLAVFVALCAICLPASGAALLLHGGATWAFGLAAIPFSVLILLSNSVFRAEFRKRAEITARIAVSLSNSAFTIGFAFLLARPTLAPIWGDFLSMALPGAVILALFTREAALGHARELFGVLRSPRVRGLLAFAIPLSIAGVAFVLYSNAASLLLRGLAGLGALGEYYFALQLMNILEKPMTILAGVVLAGFAQEPGISPEEHRRIVGFNLLVFPTLAAGVAWGAPLLMSVADALLGGLEGEPLSVKYAMAPVYASLFALAVPARSVEFLISALAIARGRPDVNRNTHVFTAAICLPVLALLVWRFGAWGAALLPVVYQLVFQSLQAWQLWTLMPEILPQTLRAAVTATGLLALVLIAAPVVKMPLLFPLAAVAYALGGHLLGAWNLRALLLRRRKTEAPLAESAVAPPS